MARFFSSSQSPRASSGSASAQRNDRIHNHTRLTPLGTSTPPANHRGSRRWPTASAPRGRRVRRDHHRDPDATPKSPAASQSTAGRGTAGWPQPPAAASMPLASCRRSPAAASMPPQRLRSPGYGSLRLKTQAGVPAAAGPVPEYRHPAVRPSTAGGILPSTRSGVPPREPPSRRHHTRATRRPIRIPARPSS